LHEPFVPFHFLEASSWRVIIGTVLDLLRIPGLWLRPSKPPETVYIPQLKRALTIPGHDARQVRLLPDGDAEWEYLDGHWAVSGHWKIAKGHYLSIFVINPDSRAVERGEQNDTFYYELLSISDEKISVRRPFDGSAEETWQAVKKDI